MYALRIKSYELLYKAISENTEQYKSQIEDYNQKIDPTSVERILKLAEKEMEHRISLEKEILKREDYFEKIGLIFAIFLTVIG
ncbi:MAG: DUF2335 domain-containing protein, partial [Bacteroidota bacterium]